MENRKRRIYHKLLVSSQSQAIARAAALGLVERVPPRPRREPVSSGPMLVAVRGPDGVTRRQVVRVLADRGIAFTVPQPVRHRLAGDETDEASPTLVALVDPVEPDWEWVSRVDVPMLLVRSTPPSAGETIEALGRGVAGIVAGPEVPHTLLPTLLLADLGHLTVEPAAAAAVMAGIGIHVTDAEGRLPDLTARESDILDSIAAGHTVRQTARWLGIAEKTVQNIQARLFRKLGARNRATALVAAHALGLLPAKRSPTAGSGPMPFVDESRRFGDGRGRLLLT